MNIKELKEKLENLPENMEIFLADRVTMFGYGLLNSVEQKEIYFTEEEFPDEEDVENAPREVVLILSEE